MSALVTGLMHSISVQLLLHVLFKAIVLNACRYTDDVILVNLHYHRILNNEEQWDDNGKSAPCVSNTIR